MRHTVKYRCMNENFQNLIVDLRRQSAYQSSKNFSNYIRLEIGRPKDLHNQNEIHF